MIFSRLRNRSDLVYVEVFIKHALAFLVFLLFFLPGINYEFEVLQKQDQGAVLSMLGFLMAGGIIGAFELSYQKTRLSSTLQRYLAHLTKLLIYLSVYTLLWIGQKTMEVSGGFFNDWIFAAGLLVVGALISFDIWDVVAAVQEQLTRGKNND